MKSRMHTVGLTFALAGGLLFVLSFVVAAETVVPMLATMAAHDLKDPEVTAAMAGEILVTLAARSIAAFPALLLLTLALVTTRYRARWFFWLVIAVGAAALFLIPVGTCFGLFFLIHGWRHHREFMRTSNSRGNA